jgi:hypothetical protein
LERRAEMPQYRVTWNVVIDARNEEEAAREAEREMRERGQRTYFIQPYPGPMHVGGSGPSVYVDLDYAAGPYEAPRAPYPQTDRRSSLMEILNREKTP